jgi:hypothetical protein
MTVGANTTFAVCGFKNQVVSHLKTFSSAALRLRLDATENSSRLLEPGGSRFASSVMYGTLCAQKWRLCVENCALLSGQASMTGHCTPFAEMNEFVTNNSRYCPCRGKFGTGGDEPTQCTQCA